MTLAIVCTHKDPSPWCEALQQLAPELDIQVWPDVSDPAAVSMVLCWKHPPGVLLNFPNLQCICSMGAGVDHMLGDPALPADVPVVRLVDPMLAQSMFEYVCATVMYYYRDLDLYQGQQQRALWLQQLPRSMGSTTIGVMGLGELGGFVAQRFAAMGFKTIGWSRSSKAMTDVSCYVGQEGLAAFLAQTQILVCLLPLTDETRGILNADVFNALPRGACIINVARGEHLVEQDLLEALASEQVRGACLDVFQHEPLASTHPFWGHQNILLTPHCSSITNPSSVAPQVMENYRRLQHGETLLNRVDLQRGY
ncbi:Glyoxylate/hydroxypyruvate reductase A [Thalassocella blandensis]|nr:Glyoxylate/hydroxypyruvate reductase A [Thalassocella blandensis]